jgi:hypothetical protein
MKGVDWSMPRKVLEVVSLLIRVAYGYSYTKVTTLIAEKVSPWTAFMRGVKRLLLEALIG